MAPRSSAARCAPPRFQDPLAGDLRLLPDDPGIDQALYLPGINDGYCGPAPDIGAFEYCEEEAVATRRRPAPTGHAKKRYD